MKLNYKRTISLVIALVLLTGLMNLTSMAQTGVSARPAGGSIFEARGYSAKSSVGSGVAANELAADFSSLGGGFKAGDYLVYEDVDFKNGEYNTVMMMASVLNEEADKKISICVDGTASKVGEITISSSTDPLNSDVNVFREFYAGTSSVTGVHDVYLVFQEDTNLNIDWFTFSSYNGTETAAEKDVRMTWWRNAHFGQFIHWGSYAYLGGLYNGQTASQGSAEWLMKYLGISKEDYAANCAKLFNPVEFDAEKVVSVAKDAGQKYMVITSRHHEGFSMFDTKIRGFKDYSIMSFGDYKGPDPIGALSEECKKQGLKFGVYYTIFEWHDDSQTDYGETMLPGRKEEYRTRLKGQLRELIENYDVDILWFDGEWPVWWSAADGQDLYKFVRTMKPAIIINNRTGGGRTSTSGDFGTPEGEIPATGLSYDWESCMTLNNNWGYHQLDNNWKNPLTVVNMVVDCASKGGNFLLNVGPDGLGRVPQPSQDILREVGTWLNKHGESIYNAGRSCFTRLSNNMKATTKDGKLYLHLPSIPADKMVFLPKLENEIFSVKLLSTGKDIPYIEMKKDYIILDLAGVVADPYDTVIEISVDGVPVAAAGSVNYAQQYATVAASSVYSATYDAGKAVDGNYSSRWRTPNSATASTLTLTYSEPITITSAFLLQYTSGSNYTRAYNIEYWEDEEWKVAYTGGDPGAEATVYFAPVTSDRIRLNLTSANRPSFYEFQLFNKDQISISTPVSSKLTYAAPFDVAGMASGGDSVILKITDDFGTVLSEEVPVGEEGTWSYAANGLQPGKVYIKAFLIDADDEIVAFASSSATFRGYVDLAKGKSATASSSFAAGYVGAMAVDGDLTTRWAPLSATSDPLPVLTVDLGEMTAFNRVIIDEAYDVWVAPNGYRCRGFTIEYYDGDEWTLLTESTTIGTDLILDFAAVTGSQIRFTLTGYRAESAPEHASINSFEVYSIPADFDVTVNPGTIVYGFNANVPVYADVSSLDEEDEMTVTMFGQTLPVVNGTAVFKLGAADIDVKGDYYPTVKVNGKVVRTTAKLNVYQLKANSWEVDVTSLEDSAVLAFNEYIEPRKGYNFEVTVNRAKVECLRDGNSLIIPLPLNDGDAIQIKNVKYPVLFPSYTFTFSLTYSSQP